MGIADDRTLFSSLESPQDRRALIPLSERARFMDFVKLRGVVEGSLRSFSWSTTSF